MLSVRRKAFQSARSLGVARPTRRYASGQHGKDGDEVHHFAGTSKEHGEHHAGPAEESLGLQLYIALAILPLSYGTYLLSRPSADGTAPGITRKIIDTYQSYVDTWRDRNTLHTDALERAAHDRALFHASKQSSHVNLRFPELFNTGSPFNVVAGQGGGNIDSLVAHYEKLNLDAEDKKAEALEARAALAAQKATK